MITLGQRETDDEKLNDSNDGKRSELRKSQRRKPKRSPKTP